MPCVDLPARIRPVRDELRRAMDRVIDSGRFALGPEVEAFEDEFASFTGSPHCVGVASGTSALHLALSALGVGPGDEVLLPSLTFVADAWAVVYLGARPVFVDVEPDSLTLDPERVKAALGPRTRVILPVHLFGRPAGMDAILGLADSSGVTVLEDAAQAAGAEHRGRRAGSLGLAGCFSFYPTKNLGAFGEAGAVTTRSAELAAALRELRNQARSADLRHDRLGFNARMDALQAAVLRVMLPRLAGWNERRRAIAERYDALLAGAPLRTPAPAPGHVYHQYAIRHPHRDRLRQELARRGVESAVHYGTPIHLQKPFLEQGWKAGDLPVTEELCRTLLALPIHPELGDDQVERVARAVRECAEEIGRESR